jgi:hypothetical protein
MFQWFLESLWNQCLQRWPITETQTAEWQKQKIKRKIQIVFIDSHLWNVIESNSDTKINTNTNAVQERYDYLNNLIRDRFTFIHSPPKQSPFQGPDRLTKDQYFCAANARNSGVCLAIHPFIQFVDDLSILTPKWLSRVFHAVDSMKNKKPYIIAGAYKKMKNMVVDLGTGIFVSGDDTNGIDSRWNLVKDGEKQRIKIKGGQLYGCSFGMPIDFYLSVNGQNEFCDSLGGEDYEFGIRLERQGYEIIYDRELLTYESSELHHTGSNSKVYRRADPVLTKEKYIHLIKKHDPEYPLDKIQHEKWDSSHWLLDMCLHGHKLFVDNYGQNLKNIRKMISNPKFNFTQNSRPAFKGTPYFTKSTKHFFTNEALIDFNQ